jgi:broad specificity phosphatase PhoE
MPRSNNQEKILIISHGTTLSFLQSMFIGDSFDALAKRRFIGLSGSVSKLTFEANGKVVINYLNQRI